MFSFFFADAGGTGRFDRSKEHEMSALAASGKSEQAHACPSNPAGRHAVTWRSVLSCEQLFAAMDWIVPVAASVAEGQVADHRNLGHRCPVGCDE
jgi:hypothetical protein